ncbi:hypothetical protein CPC08DRAFT_642930 [Agrocybe pediades]|nr:hypothetical protein CPC08DRAFT_642930 [Agrocybe pediades]
MNAQLHPLEVNPITGEPFLRLRSHPNIIITPPRDEDIPAFIPLLNDVTICDWMSGPPYPYTLEHSTFWVNKCKSECEPILKQLHDAKDNPDPIIVRDAPIRYIREVKEDGTDIFIGDVGFIRCPMGELMSPKGLPLGTFDWENKQKMEDENNALPAGDPRIIWSIGDFLDPKYHGKGIMTDAVRTFLHEWGIPRMGIRHIWAATHTGNIGSVKVFLKNDFKLIFTHEEHAVAKGKMRGINLLEWKMDSDK